jgi:hypothetical protein
MVHGSDVAGAIDSEAFDIENIEKILHQFTQNPPELSGWCGTRIAFAIQNGTGSVTATFKPDALNLFATNGSKLHLESGVITFNRTIAPNAQAGTITLENVNVSSSSADFSAKGVRGTLAIARVVPFQTPGDQTITVETLTSGKVSLTDGSIVFHAEDEHNVIIRQTRWQSMGGVVSSENAKVDPAKSSADFTVVASDVELGQLLDVLGQGKVSGHGKVTATIPLRIQGENIALGEGAVTAQPGGILHVADAKAIADTLAASDPRFASGGPYANLKNDLAQAMADFEFQTLRADITRGENGLRADVHLAGRGRTGSKRAYDFELRISGIDQALALALGLRNAFEGK